MDRLMDRLHERRPATTYSYVAAHGPCELLSSRRSFLYEPPPERPFERLPGRLLERPPERLLGLLLERLLERLLALLLGLLLERFLGLLLERLLG